MQHQNKVLDLVFFFSLRNVYIYTMTDFKLYNVAGDCGVVRTVVVDAATIDI